MDVFKLKDGRKIEVDFTSTESILSISKSDWKEIHEQLEKWLRIACSQLTGEEVYDLLRK
jgi:predicted DNA-binding antitoxin AbrB/MazE fold protein